MAKKGKKYVDSAKLIDRAAQYDVNEAMELTLPRRPTTPIMSGVATTTSKSNQFSFWIETKMPDLNAASLEAAMSMIAGTARSMGVLVEE